MKGRTIGYWTATGLTALVFGSGGIFQLLGNPGAVEGIRHLGYPAHFIILLGVWKLLGALAISTTSIHKIPRLREWAYAGFFFNLSGAVISHIASGDTLASSVPAAALLALGTVSYALSQTQVSEPTRRVA